MMFTPGVIRAVKTALILVSLSYCGSASARVISATNGTITMGSGTTTGLQQVFAWGINCKAVPIAFSGRTTAGTLTKVRGTFYVTTGRCAGRQVHGFTVVYRAPANFKGSAVVEYALKASNVLDTYNFTRQMIVR